MIDFIFFNSLGAVTAQDLAYYVGAVFVFGVIVLVHEFGHFIVAKRVGIKVLEFALGFGPKILSTQKGETSYSWRAIPLGGFVQMAGEDAESSDPEDPRNFQNKSFGARMATVAAGPIMNYIFAFIVLFFLFLLIGDSPFTTELGKLNPGFPAYNAGLKQGDVVLSVNGTKLNFDDGLKLRELIRSNAGKTVDMVINRNGNDMVFTVTPTKQGLLGFEMSRGNYMTTVVDNVSTGSSEEKSGLKKGDRIISIKYEGDKEEKTLDYNQGVILVQYVRNSDGKKIIMKVERNSQLYTLDYFPETVITSHRLAPEGIDYGRLTQKTRKFSKILPAIEYKREINIKFNVKLIYKRQNLMTALANAAQEVYGFSIMQLTAIPMAIRGEIPVDISGPIGIVAGMRDIGTYWGVYQFIKFVAMLNICIGLLNLLPIPALDGMRLVFLAIGAIKRKTINQNTEGMIHYIGFALLLIIMVIVSYNDIIRLISGESIVPK